MLQFFVVVVVVLTPPAPAAALAPIPPTTATTLLDRRALLFRDVPTWVVAATTGDVFEPCPRKGACASSQDDASRGGRNFVEPWVYEDETYERARDRLVAALLTTRGATVDDVDDRYVKATASRNNGTPFGGDDVIMEFYFTPGDVTVQLRVVSEELNALLFPVVAARLDALRVACGGFEPLFVLRNRRRKFAVVTSPFDDFGPSSQDPAFDATLNDLSKGGLVARDLDPLAPPFEPPDAATRQWLRDSRRE